MSGLDRTILRVAVPALGSLAVDPLLTLADTAFVARLGVVPLAALGVDAAIFGFAFFGFNFLAYATTPLVAQALGRGEGERARRLAGDAVLLAVVLGVGAGAALVIAAPRLVDLMGADAQVAAPAVSYLRIRALATPAVLVVTAGHGAFRGHQDTRTPFLVAVLVNVINLVADPILIFGFGMGLDGAAWATALAQWVGAIGFLALLAHRRIADRPRGLRHSLPTIRALGRNGILVSARTGLLLLAFTYAAATATRIGAEAIAAHQVVMQVWLLAAMIADSFAIAAQPMVAEAAGAGDRARLSRLVRRLMGWGLVTGLLLAAGFWLGGSALTLLVDSPSVGAGVRAAGLVAGVMMPLAAPLFVADGVFLGLLSLGTTILSTGLGGALSVVLLVSTPLGSTLTGVWWAIAAMIAVRGLVYVFAYPRSVEMAVRS